MSLLTSLLQASTRFQQAMDNRAPRTDVPAGKSNEGAATGEPQSSTDDRFTPSQWQERNPASQKTRQLPLTQYKQTVAQDLSYVRETLRHKLAEYNVHPATALSVSKTEQGSIQLDGKIPDQVRERIQQDLNNNRGFGEALSRLSVTEPTLHFMDNALKLNQAYGVNNSLLDSLLSENQQFNGLQDVIHRYDSLRRTATPAETGITAQQRYAFSLNTRA
ncbi:hypothetical protein DET61_11441 [Marinobacter nauticus]|uniref:Uncharacterized protein n=1 Tax=Marinobacter nauticus TaxID=2743 RepID=A0A368X9K8_MARNT|nr:hypothetical protein [Marinobacter nauticus]RCW64641.1 hypothetical protein DET61_11441 [Marinobacter nauticus]